MLITDYYLIIDDLLINDQLLLFISQSRLNYMQKTLLLRVFWDLSFLGAVYDYAALSKF